MKKFWTVVDGKIGTAHTSRDGELVDFRQITCLGDVSEKGFIVSPPKGVDIEPLCVPVTVLKEVLKETVPTSFIKHVYRGVFLGVVLVLERAFWCDKQTPEAIAFRTAERKETLDALKNAQIRELYLVMQRVGQMHAHELVEIAKPSSSELGRIVSSDNWEERIHALRARVKKSLSTECVPAEWVWNPMLFPIPTEILREEFRHIQAEQAAARKEAFLAKKPA